MTLPRRRLIYLLADGAHARFVERSADTGHFVTVSRIDGTEALEAVRAEQRDEPAGRSIESVGGARHAVGRNDAYRRAKAAFASQAATALNKLVQRKAVEAVVLVAPARLIPVLREHVSPRVPIARTLAKNLIKTPDHELGAWLTTA